MKIHLASQSTMVGVNAISNIKSLGLTEEHLQAAIMEGLHEMRRSSKLHPRTDPGSRAWGGVICGLRRELLASDPSWKLSRVKGIELTHNKELNISIIVMSGDKDTGLAEGSPKSKNPKGTATESLVTYNYDLFNPQPTNITSIVDDTPIDVNVTYILLYFFDHAKKEIRYELSLPVGMAHTKGKTKVSAWKQRNILPALPYESNDVVLKEDFNDELVFEVIKKQ